MQIAHKQITWQKKKEGHLAWKHATAFPNTDRKGQNKHLMNLSTSEKCWCVCVFMWFAFFSMSIRYIPSLFLSPLAPPITHKFSLKKVPRLLYENSNKKNCNFFPKLFLQGVKVAEKKQTGTVSLKPKNHDWHIQQEKPSSLQLGIEENSIKWKILDGTQPKPQKNQWRLKKSSRSPACVYGIRYGM